MALFRVFDLLLLLFSFLGGGEGGKGGGLGAS